MEGKQVLKDGIKKVEIHFIWVLFMHNEPKKL